MTKEQAIQLYESGFWVEMGYRDRAVFQMFEDKLCMPFEVFHEALEKALGRPVFTHEFGISRKRLQMELMGEAEPPSLEDIINLIPEDKRVIIAIA